MAENESQNDQKTETRLFRKGGPGGPGRGNRKKDPIELDGDLLDMIEGVIKSGMHSKELKDRLKAAGIGIRVKQLKGSADDNPVLDPFTMDLFDLLHSLAECQLNKSGVPMSAHDVVRRMLRVCPDCDRLGTTSKDPEIEEINNDDL